MNQKQIVLGMLEEMEWVPVQLFLKRYIPRYGAILYELRKEGYELIKRTQEVKTEGRRTLEEWHLNNKPQLWKKA
jgi:hypothetical protein